MKVILACSSPFVITRDIYFISKHSLTEGFIYRVYLGFHFLAPMFFFPDSLRQSLWAAVDAHTWEPENHPSTLSPTCNYSYLLKATAPHVN